MDKKKRLFADAYCGDTAEAMQVAGYTGDPNYLRTRGNKLLQDPDVMEIIKTRSKFVTRTQNAVANRDERMGFWTDIMNNDDKNAKVEKDSNGIDIPKENVNVPLNMRLKASELLGKAEGDFIDRVDFSGKVTISDVIQQSYQVEDKSIEVIEAEYLVLREEKRARAKDEQTQIDDAEYDDTQDTQEDNIETDTDEQLEGAFKYTVGDLI